ncbi:MAG: Lrp/AsnC family transcriptional regulator, partial [Nitrososphaerales archaeon]
MVSNNSSRARVDEVDARILNWLVKDVRMPFRTIAAKVGIDERTVARRVQTMKKEGVFRETAEIDWVDLGTVTVAYVGCKTSAGDEQRAKLYKFINQQPRIVESFLTVGQNEYLLKTVTADVRELREEVLTP